MSNDKGLLSGSITILIGAVIAIMALVRGPWQAWLLISYLPCGSHPRSVG